MLVNILILVIAAIFSAYVIYSACRKYLGYNPQAPSLWARIKAWWPGFVKRHIVDDDPYQSELHAATRYADDGEYPYWDKVPKEYRYACIGNSDHYSGVFIKYYRNIPRIAAGAFFEDWSPAAEYANTIKRDGIFPEWRDSLRHRPGK